MKDKIKQKKRFEIIDHAIKHGWLINPAKGMVKYTGGWCYNTPIRGTQKWATNGVPLEIRWMIPHPLSEQYSGCLGWWL